ncbi:unnamed protein product, partial [marine sediment metagenome]
ELFKFIKVKFCKITCFLKLKVSKLNKIIF